MKSFEMYGQWRNPDMQQSVGGILSFSPRDGIRLNLIGALHTSDNPLDSFTMTAELQQYPLIWGITTDGKHISLIDSAITSTKLSANGYPTQILRPSIILVGYHFQQLEEVQTDTVQVMYSYLQDWYGRSGVTWKIPQKVEDNNNPIELTYTFPKEVTATTVQATINITPTITSQVSAFSPGLLQRVSMQITAKSTLHLTKWMDDFIAPLQHFITFATDRPNAIDDLKVVLKRHNTTTGETHEHSIDVFFEPLVHIECNEKELTSQDMFFTLDQLPHFEQTIEQWLSLHMKLSPMLRLFFGTYYAPHRYLDTRFLLTLQIMEVYYRHTHNKQVPQTDEPQYLFSGILDYLFARGEDILLPLVKKKDSFIEKVITSKNYYTYYDETLKSQAAQEIELYWINEALMLLMRRVILHDIGIDSEQASAFFRENKRYTSAMSLSQFSWNEQSNTSHGFITS